MIKYFEKHFNDMMKRLGLIATSLVVTGVTAKITYSETNDSKSASD